MSVQPVGPQRRKPKLITLDTITPGKVTWLWYPYIPIGTVTALFGRGGVGKTHITCDIATRLSRGLPFPASDGPDRPQQVLMLSAEDDPGKVLVPRLLGMGADLTKIAIPDFQFVLDKRGIDDVSELMRDFAATVVFIDPIVYYAGGKMDINKSNEVREMIEKLKMAADQADCAVMIVGHTRKSQEGSEADSMMGSADWINAARSGLLVTETNDGTKIMKHVKANWGPRGDAFTFSFNENGFSWDEAVSPDDQRFKSLGGRPPARREQAVAFLRQALANGPVYSIELLAMARDEGIAKPTLDRAKPGVAVSVFDERRKTWMWALDTNGDQP